MELKKFVEYFVEPNSLIRLWFKKKGKGYYLVCSSDKLSTCMSHQLLNRESNLSDFLGHNVLGLKDIYAHGSDSMEAINIVIEQDVDNGFPIHYLPVLARIQHLNSLGTSTWFEVVYFDGEWKSYGKSKTFQDGEKVLEWKYCTELFRKGEK